jgi:hypothetical protein
MLSKLKYLALAAVLTVGLPAQTPTQNIPPSTPVTQPAAPTEVTLSETDSLKFENVILKANLASAQLQKDQEAQQNAVRAAQAEIHDLEVKYKAHFDGQSGKFIPNPPETAKPVETPKK